MKDITSPYEAQVTRGIQFLDQIDTSLLDEINLETLSLISPCNCVLGQIAHKVIDPTTKMPDYYCFITPHPEIKAAEPRYEVLFMHHEEAQEHGFCLTQDLHGREVEPAYRELTSEWARQLNIRKDIQKRMAEPVILPCGHEPSDICYKRLADDQLECSPCHHSRVISVFEELSDTHITTLIYDGEGPYIVINNANGEDLVIDYDGERVPTTLTGPTDYTPTLGDKVMDMAARKLGLI